MYIPQGTKTRVGRTVLFTLAEHHVRSIIERRRMAGHAAAQGNTPREGDTFPALIVQDYSGGLNTLNGDLTAEQVKYYEKTSAVSLQVFLDGTDTLWATSVQRYDERAHRRLKPDVQKQKDDVEKLNPTRKHRGEAEVFFRDLTDADYEPDPNGKWTEI